MPRFPGFLALVYWISGAALSAEEPPVAAESELRELVDRYVTDRDALSRRYPVESSPTPAHPQLRFKAGIAASVGI